EQPVDPDIATSIGFFLDDWQPKTFEAPSFSEMNMPEASTTVQVTMDVADIITKIPDAIFGQNANSWMSQIVTEPALMNHLTALRAGMIRFPGGSISDLYFWNANPGQRPADAPEELIGSDGNTIPGGYWYGKNTDSWTISLDNYYNMLQQSGST